MTLIPKIKLLLFGAFGSAYKKRLFADTENGVEFKLLTAFLKQNPVSFLDVGANKGEFVHTALRALPAQKIYAFEPLPWFSKKLKALFKNVKVFELALSDKTAETTLYVPVNNGVPDDSLSSVIKPTSGNYDTYTVKLRPLDDLAEKENIKGPAFLKIDVEGHEFEVLKGAEKFIHNEVQAMLIEIEERHHNGKKLADMINGIEQMGFKACYYHPHKKLLVSFSEEPSVFQEKEHLNTSFYVNNFWFFAKQLVDKSVVATLNKTLA